MANTCNESLTWKFTNTGPRQPTMCPQWLHTLTIRMSQVHNLLTAFHNTGIITDNVVTIWQNTKSTV